LIEANRSSRGFTVTFDTGWLGEAPLTAAALTEEQQQWETLGMSLRIKERDISAIDKKRSS
jgi:exopolyphosphatase / guanosine-5'-triphosphate,3'-diphosphate pyrophosphatase